MKDQENPCESNSVLVSESSNFPEGKAKWIFEESSDVLECSPLLGHISWFTSSVDKLSEITVGLLGKGSTNHISSFVHVWVTIHKSFNTS